MMTGQYDGSNVKCQSFGNTQQFYQQQSHFCTVTHGTNSCSESLYIYLVVGMLEHLFGYKHVQTFLQSTGVPSGPFGLWETT